MSQWRATARVKEAQRMAALDIATSALCKQLVVCFDWVVEVDRIMMAEWEACASRFLGAC